MPWRWKSAYLLLNCHKIASLHYTAELGTQNLNYSCEASYTRNLLPPFLPDCDSSAPVPLNAVVLNFAIDMASIKFFKDTNCLQSASHCLPQASD